MVEGQQAQRIAGPEGAVAERLDEVGDDLELAAPRPEVHRRGDVNHRVHRRGHPLPLDPHQPLAAYVTHAGAQVDATRVGMVEEAAVGREGLPSAQAAAAVSARPLATEGGRQPVVELLDPVAHGAATLSMIFCTSAGASSARRSS